MSYTYNTTHKNKNKGDVTMYKNKEDVVCYCGSCCSLFRCNCLWYYNGSWHKLIDAKYPLAMPMASRNWAN